MFSNLLLLSHSKTSIFIDAILFAFLFYEFADLVNLCD